MAEHYDAHPAYVHHVPDLAAMLKIADAGLVIGDKGWLADDTDLHTLDLGHAWRLMTGLPFVYALWLACPGSDITWLSQTLSQAKEWGLTQFDVIAEEEALRLGCTNELCLHYLNEVMDYDLGASHLQALKLFGTKYRSCKLQPLLPELSEKRS